MSFQRPIFDLGLYGKANHEFLNGLSDTRDFVLQNFEAIRWADLEMRKCPNEIRWFLGVARTAHPMAGQTNRWTYDGYPIVTSPVSGSQYPQMNWEASNGQEDQFKNAINLREMFNDANFVDGVSTTNLSVGPVGSQKLTSGAWSTSELKNIVVMGTFLNKDGSPLYFFSAPNAIACNS